MPRIPKLIELARQCFVQANSALNPEAKDKFQRMGEHYVQEADELRRTEVTRAVFPNDRKTG